MSGSDEETEELQVWKALSEAGLVEIRLDEFAARIRDVKRIVMIRLHKLLDFNASLHECESAAYLLGTLKELELKLQGNAPKSPNSSEL